jgi:Flp pilus assembly pilin Flp
MTVYRLISRLAADSGQTMAEYAVVLGLIVIVTLATFTQLGDAIENAVNAVRTITLK